MNKARTYFLLLLLNLPSIAVGQFAVDSETKSKERPKITLKDFKYNAGAANADDFFNPIQKKPGYALVSSAIIPGSGQAANGKWLRAGGYLLAEALLLTVHFSRLNDARQQERGYEQFANENWSVVNYSQWLVDYYDQNGLSGDNIDELRNQIEGVEPSYDTSIDWNVVDIELLREIERNTPFIYPDRAGNNFSHSMPSFGSQQYYELISKYYQYGPGWRDFGSDQNGRELDNRYKLNWNGSDMPFNFFRGASLAEQFNDNYRLAGNMLSLLVLNHIVSAFDAFLTVKIKNNRLKAEANPLETEMFSLKYRF